MCKNTLNVLPYTSFLIIFVLGFCKTCRINHKTHAVKNKRISFFKYAAGLICLAAILILGGCSNRTGDAADKDSLRTKRLAALDDSINNFKPTARKMIDKGMAEAKDSTEWCEYAVRLGKFYLKENKHDSMMICLNKVRNTIKRLPESKRTNNIMGCAYEYEAGWQQELLSDMTTAIKLHKTAFSKIMDSDNKSSLSDIAANIGDAYYLTNNFPEAAAYYRKALFLVDSLKLPKEKNITLFMGLARIYESLGDQSEAKRYYAQSEKYLHVMQHNMQVYFLNSFGSYYYKNGEYEKSLDYFKRLERLVKKTDGEKGLNMALCRINMADVYLNLGEIDKAEEYLDFSEPFYIKNNIGVGLHYGNSIRIGILLKRKQYGKIKDIIEHEHVSGRIEYAIQKIRNKYLRDYCVATGNAMAALRNKLDEDQKEDSLMKSNSYMRASEIIQRFSEDTLSLHHDIAMAEKQKKADEAKIITGGMAAALIIVVLLFFVWSMHVRKEQIAEKMERFKLRLENTRNRISPHFIFNILNNRIYSAGQKEKDELMTLAQLIRMSLDVSRDTFIPLDEELDFVKKYIEVQSYVLRPDFLFTLNVPDNVNDTYIPAMSIQILAENAIKHGLKGLDRQQKLYIEVRKDDGVTTISVEDNGRGFDSTKGSGNGLGMNIIRQTMAAVNRGSKKPKMDMDIKNVYDSDRNVTGCRITISIRGKININRL